VSEPSAESFNLSVPAEAGHITTVRTFAAAVARRFGFDEDVIEDVKLAVSEACAGPIDAGVEGEIELLVRDEEGALRYEIRSAAWTAPAPPSIDGALIDPSALVRALFDDAERLDDDGYAVTRFSTASRAAAGR
jgi:hypothetical protein